MDLYEFIDECIEVNELKKHIFLWISIIYFVLNLLNTLFLTANGLNQYVIPFNLTFGSLVFSFLGNFAILGIFYLIGIICIKREKWITVYLLSITLLLNVAIIVLQYYIKNYKLAFSIFNFSLIKNPTGGFGKNVFLDWVFELFINYRIICIIPFVVLLICFIVNRKGFIKEKCSISWKKVFCMFILLIGFSISSYSYYRSSLKKNWQYSTEYAQYGCQYAGVYNYYVGEFVFHIDNRILTPEQDDKDIEEYNKNKESYVNVIDGKTYSNQDNQTGILKGKNLYVIQMESTMSFCFEHSYNGIEVTPYLNSLFQKENCFYFDHVYTTVGVGNTSDAEFSFFTGLYPTGDMTIVWEWEEYDFELLTLGNYFKDYKTYSYNGTNESFYNHNNFHESAYGIDNFRGLETFETEYPREKYPEKYLGYWISDSEILKWAAQTAKQEHQNGYNSFSFVETITPHNPFYDLSAALPGYIKDDFDLGMTYYQLENYINQVKYDDKLLYDFLMDASNPNSENYLENTVFILYGDHGNGLSKGAYESLFKRKLTALEYRQLLLNIPVIFYDPTGTIEASTKGMDPNILSMTKSNTDLHRTVVNLFGFEETYPYYGVNMFSGEPSYSYDPKNFDIITDDFIYNAKNEEFSLFKAATLNMDIVNHICEKRKVLDGYLNQLV